ncbi:MAG TPA: urea ABC transporter permease subunit UrtB [Casimicrobiaceae bacterium]|nr:urea ABC transporter permease subunit UrtB [Casimicrobiaceae bacterium]
MKPSEARAMHCPTRLSATARLVVLALALVCCSSYAMAIAPEIIRDLAFGDGDVRDAAIAALVASGDARALPVLEAWRGGGARRDAASERVLLVDGDRLVDAATGAPMATSPPDVDEVMVNNRLRRTLDGAIGALRLASPERGVRMAAAKALAADPDAVALPAINAALARERDPEVLSSLTLTRAAIQLASADRETRLAAIRALADSDQVATRTLLEGLLARNGDRFAEPDEALRAEALKSLRIVESRLARGDAVARVFSGLSLGSILLLAALGLAITYGLMGVINMAHGELIMLGAYAAYVVQNVFRLYAPGAFDLYLLCAVPAAFATSALVGMALERTVIRHLYGRPLETLLATWGLSLILIQCVRTIFGAQNVQVENPSWMAGGVEVMTGVVLPWSRIVIAGFAAAVLVGIWLLLTHTRLGLFVRSVTQNRAMASALGVPTARVDMLAFGVGSGLAGVAGCALSQIGNVGPDLGQSYIVDSFMVVVLGGVGQLAGTVSAALGLGVVNKFLEAWSGAVLAKIAVLVFIILFIQKRPQGLFAFKGRAIEA